MLIELEKRIMEILPSLLEERRCYLVDLKVRPGKVEVYADNDMHITVDDCSAISRSLEQQLNKEFSFSDSYQLEVSSPGMNRPLKVLQQYLKSVGKVAEVLLQTGDKKRGRLLYANSDKIILEEEINTEKKEQIEIPLHQIKSTTIVFAF